MKNVKVIEIQQLSTLINHNYQFIDLRDEHDFKRFHLDFFINIPSHSFEKNINKLNKKIPIVLLCYSGIQSKHYATILSKQNYKVIIVNNGIYDLLELDSSYY